MKSKSSHSDSPLSRFPGYCMTEGAHLSESSALEPLVAPVGVSGTTLPASPVKDTPAQDPAATLLQGFMSSVRGESPQKVIAIKTVVKDVGPASPVDSVTKEDPRDTKIKALEEVARDQAMLAADIACACQDIRRGLRDESMLIGLQERAVRFNESARAALALPSA